MKRTAKVLNAIFWTCVAVVIGTVFALLVYYAVVGGL